MNEEHARLCASPQWAETLQTDVLPWLTAGVELGPEMIEVGPGPGAATDWLRHKVRRLVAVEYDQQTAEALAERFAGGNVTVVHGDATALSFADGSFDTAGSFTMLHHVPGVALQNQLLAETFRVLRPGGMLIGSDSLSSDRLHRFHEGDTYHPIDPTSLLVRLQMLGFTRITIRVDGRLKFIAYRPGTAASIEDAQR
jgi:ubiquinone/menaquinone biosynthesis C-methylase UbiE